MTKLDQLLAKLTTSPVEAQQAPDPHDSPQTQPAPEIKAKRERRARVGPAAPTPGGEARAHAEAWLQAVRHWQPRTGVRVVVGSGPPRSSGSRMQVVGIGSYGGPPAAGLTYREIMTPIGWLSEHAVREAITQNAEPCLLKLQAGGGPATLIDPRGGWRWDREVSLTCAVALLELAVVLNDLEAQRHLDVVRRVKAERV